MTKNDNITRGNIGPIRAPFRITNDSDVARERSHNRYWHQKYTHTYSPATRAKSQYYVDRSLANLHNHISYGKYKSLFNFRRWCDMLDIPPGPARFVRIKNKFDSYVRTGKITFSNMVAHITPLGEFTCSFRITPQKIRKWILSGFTYYDSRYLDEDMVRELEQQPFEEDVNSSGDDEPTEQWPNTTSGCLPPSGRQMS